MVFCMYLTEAVPTLGTRPLHSPRRMASVSDLGPDSKERQTPPIHPPLLQPAVRLQDALSCPCPLGLALSLHGHRYSPPVDRLYKPLAREIPVVTGRLCLVALEGLHVMCLAPCWGLMGISGLEGVSCLLWKLMFSQYCTNVGTLPHQACGQAG